MTRDDQPARDIETAAIQAFALGIPLWAYLDAAASVRLDREGDGQTYAIEFEEETP